jgi:hypothetical protein
VSFIVGNSVGIIHRFASSTVRFQDLAGKTFKWKGNGPGLAFEVYLLSLFYQQHRFDGPWTKCQLYAEDNKSSPLARFHKSRRILDKTVEPPAHIWTQALLDYDSRAEQMLDDVVVSFLFLEKGRRTRENSTMLRADVLGMPHTAVVLGNSVPMLNGGV